MATDLAIYTGKLGYKGIEFDFVFDKEELRLIPPADKSNEVRFGIIMKKIGDGPAYTFASPTMEEPYLIGKCNETGQTLVFLTRQGAHISSHNNVLFVEIAGYILYKAGSVPISKMSFTCPELDCIHPVTQGFHYTFNFEEFDERGVLSVSTEDYDATTTETRSFQVDGKDVQVYFGISRSCSTKIGESPLTLRSTMTLKFEPTEDYSFVVRLWFVAKEFIQFLCYRRNVFLPEVQLSTPAEDEKTLAVATFYMLGETGDEELETLKKGKFIQLSYLSGKEGEILTDIADEVLYTRHLPKTYESGRHIDAARFVMITAAFEWEFKRAYPEGVPKGDEELALEETVTKAIQSLIDGSTGDLKNRYKDIRYHAKKSDTLEKKIIHMGAALDPVIGVFGKQLYAFNDTELIYSEMGRRLSDQRNNFAHGNLNIDFIDKSLLDLLFAERMVYAMQLQHYGVDDKNIQKAINELFSCRIMIE